MDWRLLGVATVLAVVIFAAGIVLLFLARQVFRVHRVLLERAARRLPQPLGAFPVQPLDDRPGRFRVRGVMRQTEEEMDWLIGAEMAANAVAKAELRGLVVTRVERCADAGTEPPQEERRGMADVCGPAAAGGSCLAV